MPARTARLARAPTQGGGVSRGRPTRTPSQPARTCSAVHSHTTNCSTRSRLPRRVPPRLRTMPNVSSVKTTHNASAPAMRYSTGSTTPETKLLRGHTEHEPDCGKKPSAHPAHPTVPVRKPVPHGNAPDAVPAESQPGQRVAASGAGHATTSEGSASCEDAQKPTRGHRRMPPGHSAPNGQGWQLSATPHAHRAASGEDALLHAPVAGDTKPTHAATR